MSLRSSSKGHHRPRRTGARTRPLTTARQGTDGLPASFRDLGKGDGLARDRAVGGAGYRRGLWLLVSAKICFYVLRVPGGYGLTLPSGCIKLNKTGMAGMKPKANRPAGRAARVPPRPDHSQTGL